MLTINKRFYILAGLAALLFVSAAFAQYGDSAAAKKEEAMPMGDDHRSAVSKVAEELNKLAAKDKGVGEELKAVAKEESESKEKVAEAIKKVESRNYWKTLLLGTDYKNLGALRSEMVTTQNHLDRLMKALERTADPAVKAKLEEQKTALEDSKAKVEAFIKANESKFSFLGWVVRLFRK